MSAPRIMRVRWSLGAVAVLLGLSMSLAGCAHHGSGADAEGTPVVIRVLDEAGVAVPTAVVRHPKEDDPHRVNSATGEWEASVLYMPDGTELTFEPGQAVQFEISAPGFVTQSVQYDIRRRNNLIEIKLSPIDYGDDNYEDPVIQFGRDRPRDIVTTSPAN